MEQNAFEIKLKNFHYGAAPMASFDSLTKFGNEGHYSVATNVDVLSPDTLTQGPGLASLTNGTQAGVVDQLIQFIMDKATAADVTYALGTSKMFKLSSTTVSNAGGWPQTVTNMTDGESLVEMGGNVYGFYNKAAGGDIFKMPIATEVIDPDWGSTTPVGFAALQKAAHPSDTKEDIICFGNGRYLGVYIGGSNILYPTKLDFGVGNEVVDVRFHANQWWIAVNSGVSGTNRNYGHIYLYDGGALNTILNDETAIGYQRIGFLYPLNGVMYVAYQDLSVTDGYKIGYIVGRQIKPLASFSGSLPTFAQRTLHRGTILFISSSSIYSCGAVDDALPIQISQHADAGYATVGAIASPFGIPMVASTDGATNFRLAKFSGYDTACIWKSIVIPINQGANMGYIDRVIVRTNSLGAGASCNLTLEYNDAVTVTAIQLITGLAKLRHIFPFSIMDINNVRACLDWSVGSTSNPVGIDEIIIQGHYVENT